MLLADDRVSVFFDGTLTDPQLDHPEGVAVHPDGSVWCGGERGQIFRLNAAGTSIEEVGSTDGFALGMAFDRSAEHLFVCDLKHAAVYRVETTSGRVERFTDGAPGRSFRIPNFPAFDAHGRLYVSDSFGFGQHGPGVFRVDPDGRTELWFDRDVTFANGLAIAPDGSWISVAETFASSTGLGPPTEPVERSPGCSRWGSRARRSTASTPDFTIWARPRMERRDRSSTSPACRTSGSRSRSIRGRCSRRSSQASRHIGPRSASSNGSRSRSGGSFDTEWFIQAWPERMPGPPGTSILSEFAT